MQQIQERCGNYPDSIAYITQGGALTYGELWRQSTALSAWLIDKLGSSGPPIIVYGHMQVELPVCLLACALAGRAYIPIDESTPYERIDKIIDSSCAALMISAAEAKQENFKSRIPIIDVASIGQIIHDSVDGMSPVSPVPASVKGADNFYIIYTSGSTGDPKGVQISADNLDSFVGWMNTSLPFTEQDVVLNQAPFSFDLSVMNFYPALVGGAALWALNSQLTEQPEEMFSELQDSGLTCWVSTPSFAEVCLMNRIFDDKLLPSLRTFLFCGEQLSAGTVKKLMQRFPNAKVINTYGPTEATVAMTSVVITQEHLAASLLPAGKCKPKSRILIVDSDGKETDEGEQGEIIIAGHGVSKGYLGQDELTEKSFFSIEDEELGVVRAYRTGDIGYIKDGLLYCCGRADSQIKYNGYRIELEEIQFHVEQIEGVKGAAVVPLVRNGKCVLLSAMVVTERKDEEEEQIMRRIKRRLAETLPSYMIPHKIIILDRLPLTQNGKLDAKRLRERLVEEISR
nr:D-alanine--poly(phosphoribitol) ligase subunit DltA [Paenibacillus phyllosphaerae]